MIWTLSRSRTTKPIRSSCGTSVVFLNPSRSTQNPSTGSIASTVRTGVRRCIFMFDVLAVGHIKVGRPRSAGRVPPPRALYGVDGNVGDGLARDANELASRENAERFLHAALRQTSALGDVAQARANRRLTRRDRV